MAHVELSLSGAFVPQARTPAEGEFVPGLGRWTSTVAAATEPCLIIDSNTAILAVSLSCGELLGLGKPAEAIGQPLGAVLHLLDFTAGARELEEVTHVCRDEDAVLVISAREDLGVGGREESAVPNVARIEAVYANELLGNSR